MMNLTTFNFNQAILNAQTLNYNYNAGAQYSAVVYGVDENFLMHCGISLLSLVNNTSEIPLHFFVVTDKNNDEEFSRLHSVVKNTPHALTVIVISSDFLNALPRTTIFPLSIYFRLLAPYIIKDYRYILYIDADIVALKSIFQLLEECKPEEHICCAVREPEQQENLSKSINITNGDYFNSGMLYIDIEKWNESSISQKVFECLLERRADFLYFDQDALNVVLHKSVKLVESKYNCQIKAGHKGTDLRREPPEETIFLHYVGSDKPWQLWNQQNISAYYRKYKALSPWYDVEDTYPSNANELKKYYKMLAGKYKILKSFFVFFKYHAVRFLEKKAKNKC